jgi:ABC-type transport system involved in multi-copper enzyme maturation permease subunit
VTVIVGYALREAVRRRVFLVVLLLTIVFLGLYATANHYVFKELESIHVPDRFPSLDKRTFASTFVFGLSMFATQFLGVVLAVFLTLGAIGGDAERGLLQPLVVRPIGRASFVLARFLAAAAVCVVYVLLVYFSAMVITGLIGHWWPPDILWPGVTLAGAVVLVVAVSLLGSVLLSATANGIAVFMIFGAGLISGLLGTIGNALPSATILHIARIAAWILPFQALYQDALGQLTANVSGLTGFLLQLGPFGGSYVTGWGIRVWAAGFLVLVGAATIAAFERRDL